MKKCGDYMALRKKFIKLGDQMSQGKISLASTLPSRLSVLWSESSLMDPTRNFRSFRTQRSIYFRKELQEGEKKERIVTCEVTEKNSLSFKGSVWGLKHVLFGSISLS